MLLPVSIIYQNTKCMKYNEIKVSVVIPVYNTEKYVRQAVESVMYQSLKELEIIVVDDGSTDKSLSIVEKLGDTDKRIQIYTQANQGQSIARNRGISHAHGEYIYFMDSDDLLEEDALELCYHKCKEEKLDFDAMDYEEQKERKLREKLKKYQSSMEFLVERTMENDGEIDLASMSSLPEEQKKVFIPNAEMFKEIMVEFIKAGSIDIDELRKERRNIVAEESCSFQLNEMILKIADERKNSQIKRITVRRCDDGQTVCFKDVYNEFGDRRNIYCSNVQFRFEKEME